MRIRQKGIIILCGLAIAIIALGSILWSASHRTINNDTKNVSSQEQSVIVDQDAKSVPQAQLQASDFPSPVRGEILRTVGNYYLDALQTYVYHEGNDYAEPEGAVIRVQREGKVIYAGPDPVLGNKVVIDCGQGWQVTYGCLDNLQVKTNDKVISLSAIGQVGFNPGSDSQNGQTQLHYQVQHNGLNQTPEF